MTCTHEHPHAPPPAPKFAAAIGLTLAFVAVEAVAGYFSHSLALLSDAGHNFTDAAALGLSGYAVWIARKPAHGGMTFGYHRVGILAALINAVSLVVIALLIFYEAIERLRHPAPASGWPMILVAAVAVALNLTIGFWLHGDAQHDLNVRSAYLHMIGDAVSAAGVIVGGIFVLATGWTTADPVVSILIALLIFYSSWGVLRESVNVLLEGSPAGLKMDDVIATIRGVEGIRDAHDLHVWTVGPGAIACSVHILVEEQSILEGQQILRRVEAVLASEHRINHTTVQVEVDCQAGHEMYCSIRGSQHVGHAH